MSRRIFKYPILDPAGSPISVPADAPLRLVAIQNGVPTVWFEVDDFAPVVERRIGYTGTGFNILWGPDGAEHLGSAMDAQGGYVWHVYELVGQ